MNRAARAFWDRAGWWFVALGAVVCFLLLAGLIVQAKAGDKPLPDRLVLCAMLSRELTRVEIETATSYAPVLIQDVLHYQATPDASLREITAELALKRYTTHRQTCEAMVDIVPALPSIEAARNEAWARSVATLATRLDGIEPAADRPPGDEAWRAQCDAEYSTWDPDTETVIRRGNPERVRCPCGAEVDCS